MVECARYKVAAPFQEAPLDIALLAPLLQDTVARLETQLPDASALVTRATGTTVRVTPKSTAVEPREPMLGAVLSAFTGQAFVEVSTNDLSRAGLEGATAALLERAQRAGVDPAGPRVDPGPPLVRQLFPEPGLPADHHAAGAPPGCRRRRGSPRACAFFRGEGRVAVTPGVHHRQGFVQR